MIPWRPIAELPDELKGLNDTLLWNGKRWFVGWYSEGSSVDEAGWYDSTVPDHMAAPEHPQPTHFAEITLP